MENYFFQTFKAWHKQGLGGLLLYSLPYFQRRQAMYPTKMAIECPGGRSPPRRSGGGVHMAHGCSAGSCWGCRQSGSLLSGRHRSMAARASLGPGGLLNGRARQASLTHHGGAIGIGNRHRDARERARGLVRNGLFCCCLPVPPISPRALAARSTPALAKHGRAPRLAAAAAAAAGASAAPSLARGGGARPPPHGRCPGRRSLRWMPPGGHVSHPAKAACGGGAAASMSHN
jgi:hypothetical protein